MESVGTTALGFYGMTKDPETKEFIIIVQFANKSLRSILSTDFGNLLWKKKIWNLYNLTMDLNYLHSLDYCHRDLHSGNVLQGHATYLSDFGLSRPVDDQESGGKIYGVLPY